jgi:8-oxo-dGTP pyrophosphatase MutT (NUDIX family)
MSYLRHLESCNRFDPGRFLPLLLAGRRVGFVRRDNAALLAAFPHIFRVSADAVALADTIPGPDAATQALGEATDGLIRANRVKTRRNEMFAITDGWGGPLWFELDRGMIEFFGARAYAVHLNGWRPGADGPEFWIAKRAMNKAMAPGQLDNMVAGGIGAGYSAWETVLKEAQEEAGIPEALAIRAHAAGAIRYRIELPDGMRDEVLFVYDIQLPTEFVPRNTDGEVEDFRLLSARECLRLVRETDQFKYDVNLVLIDFGLRHGLIVPGEPDYLALLEGLRGSLVRGPQ